MTSKELAKLLGVSQSTVSRSLNGSSLVKGEMAERIRAVAKEYGYEINSNAKSLKTNSTGTIGVVFPDHFIDFDSNIYIGNLFNCIRNHLQAHGYDLLALGGHEPEDKISGVERVIRNRKVDGLIVIESSISQDRWYETGHPVPIIRYNPEQAGTEERSTVAVDHHHGGEVLGEYLGRCGHKRILCVSAMEKMGAIRLREQGIRDGLKKYGVILEPKQFLHGDLTFESGYRAVMEHKDMFRDYTAVCAYNDAMALGVMEALKELQIRIPDQISVTGFDGLKIGAWFRPRLTTVSMPGQEIAEQCCRLLYAKLRGEEGEGIRPKILPQLIIRESSGPV